MIFDWIEKMPATSVCLLIVAYMVTRIVCSGYQVGQRLEEVTLGVLYALAMCVMADTSITE